jgi:hypothetical protein
MNIHKLLLIAAAVCFALAVVGVDVKVNLVPLGLLLWVLSVLL